MIPILILVISFIIDGILTNFLPYIELSLFMPLLTLISIFIIYPFYKKSETKYFLIVIIVGIIYDLFYTNLLFFNSLLFLLIAYLSKAIYKNLEISSIKLPIYITIVIITYELLTALILLIFNVVPITFSNVLYKISHSIILNIIYSEIIYLILKLVPEKYKKININ